MAVLTYKCPNCDAELTFQPESQSFACHYCGSAFSQEKIQEIYPAEETRTIPKEQNPQDSSFQAVSYQCPSCGAEIMTDETTAATFCYYCHNPVTLGSRLSGEWKPDRMIPFAFGKEDAKKTFLSWCKKKFFVDHRFFSESQLEKLSGVYFPFWLVDSKSQVDMVAKANSLRVWRMGDIEYTETSVYELTRSGQVDFSDYGVGALKREEADLLKGILPFDYSKLEDFSAPFLSGFLAEKRNLEKTDVKPQVDSQLREYAETLLRDTTGAFGSVTVQHLTVNEKENRWKYLLLPAWILTYQYRGKTYYFAMNGQTGKINGELPVSKGRLGAMFGIVAGVLSILLMLGGYFLW